MNEVIGDVFVRSLIWNPFFFRDERERELKKRTTATWSELYRTEYFETKAWKDLAQSNDVQMQSFHGNKLFWSKKKLFGIQSGATLLMQKDHVVIVFFSLEGTNVFQSYSITHIVTKYVTISKTMAFVSGLSIHTCTKFPYYCWKLLGINSKDSFPCWSAL